MIAPVRTLSKGLISSRAGGVFFFFFLAYISHEMTRQRSSEVVTALSKDVSYR